MAALLKQPLKLALVQLASGMFHSPYAIVIKRPLINTVLTASPARWNRRGQSR